MTDLAFADFVETDPEDTSSNQVVPIRSGTGPALISTRETLDFQVQGSGRNKLLNLTMPLLGLATRIREMPNYADVAMLHARVANEIENFQQEAAALGYDDATILAARYCLCAMIDESVLSQNWGAESLWPERPMLSIFHNETWGGEKVFGVLDRVIEEAHRFPDLLEFIYFCLTLGFEGKYHVMHNGRAKLDHLIEAVNQSLEKKQGEAPAKLLDPKPNIYGRKQRMVWRVPIWFILTCALAGMVAIHVYFDRKLDAQISVIAEEIDASLNLEKVGE